MKNSTFGRLAEPRQRRHRRIPSPNCLGRRGEGRDELLALRERQGIASFAARHASAAPSAWSTVMCGPPKGQPLPSVRSKRRPSSRAFSPVNFRSSRNSGEEIREVALDFQRVHRLHLEPADAALLHRAHLALQLRLHRRSEPPPAHHDPRVIGRTLEARPQVRQISRSRPLRQPSRGCEGQEHTSTPDVDFPFASILCLRRPGAKSIHPGRLCLNSQTPFAACIQADGCFHRFTARQQRDRCATLGRRRRFSGFRIETHAAIPLSI